jgi:hypothetical protein
VVALIAVAEEATAPTPTSAAVDVASIRLAQLERLRMKLESRLISLLPPSVIEAAALRNRVATATSPD